MFQQIQTWGDSILKGVVFNEARGRYQVLKDSVVPLIRDQLGIATVNRSQMGRTAPEGLKLMEEADEDFTDSLVLLEYGGNDCDLNWAEVAAAPDADHLPRTPDDVFAYTLERLVSLVRTRGGTPVLLSLPPLNAQRYLNWIAKDGLSVERLLHYLGAPERIYHWQEYYSALVTRVATAMRCPLIPIREAFLFQSLRRDLICLDGIHPNERGHQLMADVARDALNTMRFA